MGDPLTIFSAVTGAVSFFQEKKAAKKQSDAQEESLKLQQSAEEDRRRATELSNRKKRIRQVQRARVQRAQQAQSAAFSGVSRGSAAAGAGGAIASTAAANQSFVSQLDSLSASATASNIEAGNQLTAANEFAAQGQVAGAIFQQSGGFENIFKTGQSIFSGFGSGSKPATGGGYQGGFEVTPSSFSTPSSLR